MGLWDVSSRIGTRELVMKEFKVRQLLRAQKVNLFAAGISLLFCLIASGVLFAPCFATAETLDRVEVRGNKRVDSSTIMLQLSSESGKSLSTETIEKDIKSIYRTGFFENVTATLESARGAKILVFTVVQASQIKSW